MNKNEIKTIYLNSLILNLKRENKNNFEVENIITSQCKNKLTNKSILYNNKTSYDMLPGKNSLVIAGKVFPIHFLNELMSQSETSVYFSSINLTSKIPNDHASFFIYSLENGNNEIISAPINSTIWLFPGKYKVEVNGTTQQIDLEKNKFLEINLGGILISSPPQFPFSERLRLGGLPMGVFLNSKVLFSIDQKHSVFPGKYTINMENSELKEEIEVHENELKEIKTYGVQVHAPPCEKEKSCQFPKTINIHTNRLPFILMNVPLGLPFLVFKEPYEYSLEGMKGIYKNLSTSTENVFHENIGALEIHWDIKYTSSNYETKFIRIESKSSNIYGKSMDLLHVRPRHVYLPEGDYILSYVLGDVINPNSIRRSLPIHISYETVKKVEIPFFIKSNATKIKNDLEQMNNNNNSDGVLKPIK